MTFNDLICAYRGVYGGSIRHAERMLNHNSNVSVIAAEILVKDHCTVEEALRHLLNGTMVIESCDWEEFCEDNELEDMPSVDKIRTGNERDLSFVTMDDGGEFIVMYVL